RRDHPGRLSRVRIGPEPRGDGGPRVGGQARHRVRPHADQECYRMPDVRPTKRLAHRRGPGARAGTDERDVGGPARQASDEGSCATATDATEALHGVRLKPSAGDSDWRLLYEAVS